MICHKKLKAYGMDDPEVGDEYEMYKVSEVDAVLAEKDKEIAELKNSLGKLLKAKTEQIMDEVLQKTLIYGEGFIPAEHAMLLVSELRHQKYRRCLDKAKWCESEEKRLEAISPIFDTNKECWEYNSNYWGKWHKRWLELAEKFKEAK